MVPAMLTERSFSLDSRVADCVGCFSFPTTCDCRISCAAAYFSTFLCVVCIFAKDCLWLLAVMIMNVTWSDQAEEERLHEPTRGSQHGHGHSHLPLTLAHVLLALWAWLANITQVKITCIVCFFMQVVNLLLDRN